MMNLENMKDEELINMTVETGDKVREAMYTGNNEMLKEEDKIFKALLQEIFRRNKFFQYQSANRLAEINGTLRFPASIF